MRHLTTLGVAPPRDPHDRVQSGEFLSALLMRWLGISIVVWAIVFVLADLPSWWLIVAAATTLVLAGDVLWLNVRVRRDRRRHAQ
jgi:hypothetical protein